MGPLALHAIGGDDPEPFFPAEFFDPRTCNFAAALQCQKAKLQRRGDRWRDDVDRSLAEPLSGRQAFAAIGPGCLQKRPEFSDLALIENPITGHFRKHPLNAESRIGTYEIALQSIVQDLTDDRMSAVGGNLSSLVADRFNERDDLRAAQFCIRSLAQLRQDVFV